MHQNSKIYLPLAPESLFETPEVDGSHVEYFPNFFLDSESCEFMQALDHEIEWQQEEMSMYGDIIPLPRLTAWHGEPGMQYSYSGISMRPEPWTPTLRTILDRVQLATGAHFNSVLLNKYRDANDSLSWHSDDEKELGEDPTIASVSFGETRSFRLRRRPHRKGTKSIEIKLEPGSLLIMSGTTQRHWEHCVTKVTRKTKTPLPPRINLTFRKIIL